MLRYRDFREQRAGPPGPAGPGSLSALEPFAPSRRGIAAGEDAGGSGPRHQPMKRPLS